MEFDITKVYSAVNADELKVGSKCIFADTVEDLKRMVLTPEAYVNILERVYSEQTDARFACNRGKFLLAYFIEAPKDTGCKPFANTEKAIYEMKSHGWWVKSAYEKVSLVTSYQEKSFSAVFFIDGVWYNLKGLFDYFVFADDGSPCGELMEE